MGFTLDELDKIEKAFEENTYITYDMYNTYTPRQIKRDQINGLHAVIEVMKTFDKVEFDTTIEFTNKVKNYEPESVF